MELPGFLSNQPDGEIRLAGHRIGLYTVVRAYQAGHAAEQIAAEYPSLPRDLIGQVIAFYLENRSEIDAYVTAYQADLERQAFTAPGPGVIQTRQLMERIRQADREHGSERGWSTLSLGEKLQRLEQETSARTT